MTAGYEQGGASGARHGGIFRRNRLKERLLAGEKGVGCWLFSGSADAAEILSLGGFDAFMIDHEHGTGTLKCAIDQMRAGAATGITNLMRIPSNDPVYIKRALDAGVEGVMVPMVESAADAAAAVKACRYPPKGRRGAAYLVSRAADYGLSADEYAAISDENVLVICQIESAAAVDRIPEIAAVDGVDMLFIGPFDLSGSIGKLGQFADKEFQALLGRAEQAIKASPALLGGISPGADAAVEMFARGYDFVIPTGDTMILKSGAIDVMQTIRAQF